MPFVLPRQIDDHCPRCRLPNLRLLPICERCGFDIEHGVLSPPKERPCSYCGQIRLIGREHVLPNWLRAVFPHPDVQVSHVIRRADKLTLEGPVSLLAARGSSDGKTDPYNQVVWHTCEPCNTGWMSRLQNDARPLILRLAQGDRWPLSSDEKALLSRWAAMTAINVEVHGGLPSTSQSQRTHLMAGTPLRGWWIGMADLAPPGKAGGILHQVFITRHGPPSNPVRCSAAIFTIERVAFVCVEGGNESLLQTLILPFDLGMDQIREVFSLRQIWPLVSVPEPSNTRELAEQDLLSLHSALAARSAGTPA